MHKHTNKWLRFVLVATVATCASCVTVEPNNNHENSEPDYGFTRLIIKEW